MKSSRFVLLAAMVGSTPASADFYSRTGKSYLHPVDLKMEMIPERKHATPTPQSRKVKTEASEINPAVEQFNPNPYGESLPIMNGKPGKHWNNAPELLPYSKPKP